MSLKSLLLLVLLVFLVIISADGGVPQEYRSIIQLDTNIDLDETRKHKHPRKKYFKHIIHMLFAAMLMKAVIFPIAFKAMAFMSSISVMLSVLSLIVSSMVGYVKLAAKHAHTSYEHYRNIKKNDYWMPDNLTDAYEQHYTNLHPR